MSTTVKTEIPDQLWQQAQNMVEQGWVNNMELEILQKPETLKIASRMSAQLSHHLFDTLYHALAIETDSDFITADEKYFNKAQTFGHIQLLAHYSTR